MTQSFYKGKVAKLVCFNQGNHISQWHVIDIIDVDTSNDANMHINFSHNRIIRATFVPITSITNFNVETTKSVERTFDLNQELEHWRALS